MTPAYDPASMIRARILRATADLPPLPTAVLRIMREAELPDSSVSRLEKIVLTDQALTAQLLRVVNSAYYGMSGEVSSVSQAIMILGFQQVRNLAMSLSALSTFHPTSARQRDTVKCFWAHAFATAAATHFFKELKRLPEKVAAPLFVGGLIHDVGRLFLFVNYTSAYDQVLDRAAREGTSAEEAEKSLLGTTHAEVGLLIAQHWKLPENLQQMIGEHEGPFTANTPVDILVIHIADAFNKALYFPYTGESVVKLDPIAQEWLGVDPASFAEMQEEVSRRVEEMSRLFGIAA